jgi:hypothetical protein
LFYIQLFDFLGFCRGNSMEDLHIQSQTTNKSNIPEYIDVNPLLTNEARMSQYYIDMLHRWYKEKQKMIKYITVHIF